MAIAQADDMPASERDSYMDGQEQAQVNNQLDLLKSVASIEERRPDLKAMISNYEGLSKEDHEKLQKNIVEDLMANAEK